MKIVDKTGLQIVADKINSILKTLDEHSDILAYAPTRSINVSKMLIGYCYYYVNNAYQSIAAIGQTKNTPYGMVVQIPEATSDTTGLMTAALYNLVLDHVDDIKDLTNRVDTAEKNISSLSDDKVDTSDAYYCKSRAFSGTFDSIISLLCNTLSCSGQATLSADSPTYTTHSIPKGTFWFTWMSDYKKTGVLLLVQGLYIYTVYVSSGTVQSIRQVKQS